MLIVAAMRRLWLDLGNFGQLFGDCGPLEQWQDHGLGLLRTILRREGIHTDLASTRRCRKWGDVYESLIGYDMLIMNVRSYTYPLARKSAEMFKEANPDGMVVVGGMHATVSADEMAATPWFDRICKGAGENVIADLVTSPISFPRVFTGDAAKSMTEWPAIDRTLWPRANDGSDVNWPLEPPCGWGPGPVATILTSRVCPWACVMCNEISYVPQMDRPSVDHVIDELNTIDATYGPVGSVVIHDSLFLTQPSWLKEWADKYPRRANKVWPYWAAGRADTVRRWPDLFERLVRETNWSTVSIGFESGSDRMLRMINKECTADDNRFCIDLLNRIGDDMEREGKTRPRFWANIMLAIPGETEEAAYQTVRMVRSMKNPMVSLAYFSPYPGAALGYQIIAEGNSLMPANEHNRFGGQPKVKGIDYAFYDDLLAGTHDARIEERAWP